jgi:hypothetical protein
MQPFLAMITPIGGSGGHPDHGLPQPPPPGYWGGVAPPYPDQGLPGWQPRPSHPIAPGGRPPGYWGGVAPPYPDQGLPGAPPGYWGGVAPPYPDHGLPGHPPPLGIWGGGNVPMPTPPIYLPPGSIPGLKPEHPIYIPPSVNIPGFPTHPIVLPPPGSNEKPEVLENWNAVTAWTPTTGWVVAIVPSDEHPGVPTPSR